MGEARRRADNKPRDIKISPRKRAAGFVLAHHTRIESQDEEGMVYARNIFRVIDAEGNVMMEETPDGPQAVLLMSVPQPVRRALLASPALLRA